MAKYKRCVERNKEYIKRDKGCPRNSKGRRINKNINKNRCNINISCNKTRRIEKIQAA